MRPIKHQSYGPGKFEGESCVARFGYNVILNGLADSDNPELITGPFTQDEINDFESTTQDQMCQECVDTLLKLSSLNVWESSDGFVWASA